MHTNAGTTSSPSAGVNEISAAIIRNYTESSARPRSVSTQEHLMPLCNDESGHEPNQAARKFFVATNYEQPSTSPILPQSSDISPSSQGAHLSKSIVISAASRTPTEVLQQLYYMLGPKDFNAARHTCRSWMRASLDFNLLGVMLRRGGWSYVIRIESPLSVLKQKPRSGPEKSRLLSRCLARQCSLASTWRGNGL